PKQRCATRRTNACRTSTNALTRRFPPPYVRHLAQFSPRRHEMTCVCYWQFPFAASTSSELIFFSRQFFRFPQDVTFLLRGRGAPSAAIPPRLAQLVLC